MKVFKFAIPVLVALTLCQPVSTKQALAQMCEAPFEVIVTMRPPSFDFPTIWDADYGSTDVLTQFVSGVPLEDGTILSYARRLDKTSFKPLETGIVVLNRRGRAMLEKFYPAKEGEQPVRIVRLGERLVGISNYAGGTGKTKTRRQARLSWYAMDGSYKKEQILSDATYDYEAHDLLQAADDTGFVVVLHAVNRSDENDQHGVLVRFTSDGKQIWRRAYRPGIPNMLTGAVAMEDRSYIATGRIRIDDGRMAGWAMKLAHDGTILWQRIYPRGTFSIMNDAAPAAAKKAADGTTHYLLMGEASPADNGHNAAWLMEVDPLGSPVWQRYFRRDDYALSGAGIRSYPDGRIAFAANATAKEGAAEPDHVRLVTLSPRGQMIQDEGYIDGISGKAVEMFKGWNDETVIVGTIHADVRAEESTEGVFGPKLPDGSEKIAPPPPPIQKGWVLLAPGLDFYSDPCVKKPRR